MLFRVLYQHIIIIKDITMKKFLFAFFALLCAVCMDARDVYLFSYFVGERDGLHLAYSYDGLTWRALGGAESLLRPTVGRDSLMRDPSIVQGPDGVFHMVWTSGWHDRGIGYASSRDLVHWSEQECIAVMGDEAEAKNCWAPELFYDEASGMFYIFWATTIPGRHGHVASSEREKEWNHRIYCTTTRDFKTFSKTRLFFNPDFNVIDASVVSGPKGLLMFVKNENSAPAEKNIRVCRGKSMAKGFSTKVSEPITGKYWAEGPAPLYVGDTLYVYFDRYREGRYGAVRSLDDGRTWTDVSDMVCFPKGMRHGSAFTVSEEVLSKLMMATGTVAEVGWDGTSLLMDGRRVMPAMGEVHYSRIPDGEWEAEVRKMRRGGIGMIACYIFWNHIEEIEGQYDWSGQRNLRHFLEVCKSEGMPVVLRMGPFCHGEVRCGGIPDWIFTKGCKSRSEDAVFLGYVERFYRQIFTQVQGLQWKDGGPVVAAQFDNEYHGHASYLLTLKKLAINIGFDLPFYTRTGWPELRTPMPFGEMVPLYGDYADGFWQRDTVEASGSFYKAFNFRRFVNTADMAALHLTEESGEGAVAMGQYPYFTCELGGGMITSYHRRIWAYPEDSYAMAVVKLGSGSNLLGYYMYHGGTNPDGKLGYLNEMQRTTATNLNDMPVKSYEFQAPIGEFGQLNAHYYMLRRLHLFMQSYGEVLAPMGARFPCEEDIEQGDDGHLRWSVRSDGKRGFIFINNYERLRPLSAKRDVELEACGVRLPKMTIPAGLSCILPINIDGMQYATAQLIARRGGRVYLQQLPGIATEICVDGKVLRNLKPLGTERPVYKNIYLLNEWDACRLFLNEEEKASEPTLLTFRKLKEAAVTAREISIGKGRVAEEPEDSDFDAAAVYEIELPADRSGLLSVEYVGDCARLYADGKLVDDNFYNGRAFCYGLWRLPEECKHLELRILPLQNGMPIYFPREADTSTVGERVAKVSVSFLGK